MTDPMEKFLADIQVISRDYNDSMSKIVRLVRLYHSSMSTIGWISAQGNSFLDVSEIVMKTAQEAEEIMK